MIRLRPPAPDDFAHVVRRHGELYAGEQGWDDTFRELVARILADFRRGHDPRRERMWVADEAGEIAGAVLAVRARDRPETAQLRCLYVEPRFRGRGLGGALVEECVAFCRRAGYRKLVLWTMRSLVDAQRLYVRAGFRRVASEPTRAFGHDLVAETWELDLSG